MRKNFGPKPYLYPQPVLIIATYGEDGTPDAMNAAWGGISDSNRVAMYLSAGHKTVQNIKARGAFTVSIADAAHIVEADYFGVESGNKVTDKFARSGLTASKAETVDPLSSTSFRSAWSAGSSSIRTMNTDAASSVR